MIEITVCIGTSCHMRGAGDVIKTLQKLIGNNGLEKEINLKGTFCMGRCSGKDVVVQVGSEIFEINSEETEAFFIKNVASLVDKKVVSTVK